jgi:hypothetical protein
LASFLLFLLEVLERLLPIDRSDGRLLARVAGSIFSSSMEAALGSYNVYKNGFMELTDILTLSMSELGSFSEVGSPLSISFSDGLTASSCEKPMIYFYSVKVKRGDRAFDELTSDKDGEM